MTLDVTDPRHALQARLFFCVIWCHVLIITNDFNLFRSHNIYLVVIDGTLFQIHKLYYQIFCKSPIGGPFLMSQNGHSSVQSRTKTDPNHNSRTCDVSNVKSAGQHFNFSFFVSISTGDIFRYIASDQSNPYKHWFYTY